MPATVTIVRPNITAEEEKKVLENIAHVMEKMAAKQYGINVKYTLTRTR